MPVGNIDPRTDVLTLASMKLGNEEYPSTVQQAESENTGYLLYKPVHISGYTETINDTSGLGASGTQFNYTFLIAGNYDLFGKVGTTANITSAVLAFDGTTVQSGGGEGTLASFSVGSDAWYTIKITYDVSASDSGNVYWGLVSRQYA